MRLEIFGIICLVIIVALFSGFYHFLILGQEQLRTIQTTTSTTSVGVIGIQLRLKTLESAILNYDHGEEKKK